MIKLEFTESIGTGYRHRTWTRIADGSRRLSALQNQFALMEFERSEAEAMQQFRVWLWQELKDTFNVVSTEMRQLATAHKQGREVEVLVPKDAPHGAVIVRAILWLAENLLDIERPVIRGSEPGSCYEPIVDDGMIVKNGIRCPQNNGLRCPLINNRKVLSIPRWPVATRRSLGLASRPC